MKRHLLYFRAAYIWGIILLVITDVVREISITELTTLPNVSGIALGGFIFAILMTIVNYIEKRKENK